MKIEETTIMGAYVFTPKILGDERGYFFESFNGKFLDSFGISRSFVQDNESFSAFGILRGLHFQYPPYEQAKLVRVTQGEVLDVIVDIRKNSPTFLKSFSVELSSNNKKQLYAPRGMAHGFVVLSETATFLYKCDQYYKPEFEGGIRYNDSRLNLDWKIDAKKINLSHRDQSWGDLACALEQYELHER